MSRRELTQQDRLEQVLDVTVTAGTNSCAVSLSSHLSYGESSCGGYSAALVARAVTSYASHHPKLKSQPDVRFFSISLLRPVFPVRGPLDLKIDVTAISRLWSMLRVEGVQDGKLCICADVMTGRLDAPGVTLNSGWQIHPPPTPVNLVELENHRDDRWTCYHTAFHPTGFRRAQSYAKSFVPIQWSPTYNEQWVLPGWDCSPLGSRDLSVPEARWTTTSLIYLADIYLPCQENFFPQQPGRPPAIGSMAATVEFARKQERGRDRGEADWRDIRADGSGPDGLEVFAAQSNMVSGTLAMSVEIKRNLPPEGVRWLYVRTEVKNIQSGRFDLQALIFDQDLRLLAIKNGVEQLLDPSSKQRRRVQQKI